MDSVTKTMYANIGKLITSSLHIDEILEGIMKEIKAFFNPEHWSLLRLDETTGELYFLFMEGVKQDKLEAFRLGPGEGIAGTVAASAESVFVPDVSRDRRFSDRVDKLIDFKTKSIIAVPMVFRGRVYGVIEIVNSEKSRFFTEDDHMILSTIADFSAIALANSALYNMVVEQTNHDSLTGLYNRQKLNQLKDEWSDREYHARRYGDTDSVIKIVYMDINEFKDINDCFGHREGDRALVSIAEQLNGIFRNQDLLFRIGGDEYLAVLMLPNAGSSDYIDKRISNSLSELEYRTRNGQGRATLSFGISTGHIYEIEKLIDEADKNMYSSKKTRK